MRDGDMVGDISFHPTLLAGHINANRAVVTASDYPRLLAWVQDNNMLTTDSTDESKYLYDSENDLLTLPNVMDKVLQGGNEVESKAAGLPNIKGYFSPSLWTRNTGGCFTYTHDNFIYDNTGSSNGFHRGLMSLDASGSSPIYSDSVTTVQPPAITIIPQIKY